MKKLLAVAVLACFCLVGLGIALFHDRFLPGPVESPTDVVLSCAPPPRTVAEQRQAAIRETLLAIRQECQRNAAGDWDRWGQQLIDFRAELKSRIDAAKPYNPTAPGTFEARAAVLAGRDNFPLFESAPSWYLRYLIQPEALNAFLSERPLVAANRWFRQHGVDFLFVPVPKMTEVYPEHFASSCPRDRIVAPHLRRGLVELLEADVEVVDLLPLFLEARDKDSEPLFQPADPHWGPRAQALAARAIAERLKRYDCVANALASPAMWKATAIPFPPANEGATFAALTPEQQKLARASQPRTRLLVTDQTGAFPGSLTSPVVFIGDSFNCGLMELVCREINLPVHTLWGGGQTSEGLKAFVRDPHLLEGRKVVIWLGCHTQLQSPWPLPRPMTESLHPQGHK